MIELRLEGLPADVNAVHERLGQSFEILSSSGNYNNRDNRMVRRFVKVKLRTAPELGPAGLADLIQAMLADSHRGVQEAINPTPEWSAYQDGYQNALMELARLAGVIRAGNEGSE